MSPAGDPMVIQMAVIRDLPELGVVGPRSLLRAGGFEVLDEDLELALDPGRGLLDILQGLFLDGYRILHEDKLP